MRYVGVLLVLALVLWLGLKEFSATGPAPKSAPSAQQTVDQARSQLQSNEAQGNGQLQRGLNQVGAAQP